MSKTTLHRFPTKLKNILRYQHLILGVFAFCCLSFAGHEYYLSMADGEVVEDHIEFSLRLDLEDMTTWYSRKHQMIAYLGESNEHVYTDSLLTDYLANHFVITQAGYTQTLTFVGKEVEEDLLWVYFTVPSPDFSKEWKMKNTLLYSYFPDQVNVVRMETPTGKKNGYFKASQPTYTFTP